MKKSEKIKQKFWKRQEKSFESILAISEVVKPNIDRYLT